jgi:Tol biopolymer transport system component
MTDQELELRLRSWYRTESGEADRAPAALRAAVAAIPARGRRVVRLPWAGSTSRLSFRLAAVAVIAVLAVGGAFYALGPRPPAVGGPSPTPRMSSSPTSSSPSPVATPGATAMIAYVKLVNRAGAPMGETLRVWIVGADGSDAHELFPGGMGSQSGVAWSPDGTRLIYSEGGRLFLTDSSGRAPQVVGTGCASPCNDTSAEFLPDGTQLVFERNAGIATMDLASGQVVALSSTAAGYSERPRWSPDGQQIVFSSFDKFGNGSAVFVVDADGQNLRQLSTATLPARLPDWSPDGSRILFTSRVVTYVQQGGTTVQHLSQDIYTVRPDWTDLRRLTTDGNSIGATWTPDGRILFATGCKGNCAASGGLWIANAVGSNAQLLVPGGSGVDAPLWGVDAAWQPTP